MPSRKYRVAVGERVVEVEVSSVNGGTAVMVGGRSVEAVLGPPDAAGVRRLRIAERVQDVLLASRSGVVAIALDGVALEAEVQDERSARLARFGGAAARGHGPQAVKAPMPGLVVRVHVASGERVQAGQGLIVLQAMKMENELNCPTDGTVKAVHVRPGQAVEHGELLVELE